MMVCVNDLVLGYEERMDIFRAQSDNDDLKKEIEKKDKEIAELRLKLAKGEGKGRESEIVISDLRAKLDSAALALTDSEATANRAVELMARADASRCRAEVAQAELRSQNVRYCAQVTDLEAELAAVKSELTGAKTDIAAVRSKYRARLDKRDRLIKHYEGNEELKSDLAQAEGNLELVNEVLANSLEDFGAERESLISYVEKYRADLAANPAPEAGSPMSPSGSELSLFSDFAADVPLVESFVPHGLESGQAHEQPAIPIQGVKSVVSEKEPALTVENYISNAEDPTDVGTSKEIIGVAIPEGEQGGGGEEK